MIILYLHSELSPYMTNLFMELVKKQNIMVHVVYWDTKRLIPYIQPEIENVFYHKRSLFKNSADLFNFALHIRPSVVYTSGWMDRTYVETCRKIRSALAVPVVAGSDSQWTGGRQWFNVLVSPFLYKRCFSHIHISGVLQYEYARRLGFSARNILLYNYSANVEKFYPVNINLKKENYPKKLLFVGRFTKVKGLKYLVNAYNNISDKHGWTLTLIGNGPEKEDLASNKDIEVLDFMNQEDLARQMQGAGCFILPSIQEPWGVVLHEAAAAGLPILASNICGAAPYFVLNNYNGFTFNPGSEGEIQTAIEKITSLSTDKLMEMSFNSRKLSGRITPEIVANTFLSILDYSS